MVTLIMRWRLILLVILGRGSGKRSILCLDAQSGHHVTGCDCLRPAHLRLLHAGRTILKTRRHSPLLGLRTPIIHMDVVSPSCLLITRKTFV